MKIRDTLLKLKIELKFKVSSLITLPTAASKAIMDFGMKVGVAIILHI